MLQESRTRRKHGVAFTMAQARKALHPFPVYEAHFADNTVLRMSFWTKAGQPFDFVTGRAHCEIAMLAPAVDGFIEHDDSSKPWVRVRDPRFSGEAIEAIKPRTNGVKLKKAALAVVERAISNGQDMPVIPTKVLQDLREALGLAA